MEANSEEALYLDLENRVREALQKHSVEDVLEYLRHELWQLEMQTLYATKNGFGGAPDYNQLTTIINITKKVIEKLEKGEIKGPKRLIQVSLDGYLQKTEFQKIIEGRKTQTRRIHTHEWHVGKTYKIRNKLFGKGAHKILITRKFKQRLGDITLEDVKKEGFNTLEEFKQTWEKIYGSWNPNIVVTVYEFKVINEKGGHKR